MSRIVDNVLRISQDSSSRSGCGSKLEEASQVPVDCRRASRIEGERAGNVLRSVNMTASWTHNDALSLYSHCVYIPKRRYWMLKPKWKWCTLSILTFFFNFFFSSPLPFYKFQRDIVTKSLQTHVIPFTFNVRQFPKLFHGYIRLWQILPYKSKKKKNLLSLNYYWIMY